MLQAYLQVILYGIYIGSLYGLAAVGLALMFGVMDILQIAHGSIVMLGGYFCFWLFHLYHLDPLLSLIPGFIVFFLVGAMMFQVLFAQATKLSPGQKLRSSLLVAFGLILLLENLAAFFWTANIRTVSPRYQGLSYKFWGIQFPVLAIISLVLSAMLIFGLHLFLKRTYLGKSIRATAQNAVSASLLGVNVPRTYMIAMGIATLLGGAAGVLIMLQGSVDPFIGMSWTMKSMLITVLAGTGNVGGVFICGLFFGVLEAVGSMFIGAFKDIIGLVLFIVVLMWKPQGLFSIQRRLT